MEFYISPQSKCIGKSMVVCNLWVWKGLRICAISGLSVAHCITWGCFISSESTVFGINIFYDMYIRVDTIKHLYSQY